MTLSDIERRDARVQLILRISILRIRSYSLIDSNQLQHGIAHVLRGMFLEGQPRGYVPLWDRLTLPRRLLSQRGG